MDRAGLDAALALGIGCGGWCPAGRLAEDGPIPDRYPLRETDSAAYHVRTRCNVIEADATVVLKRGALSGGSALTVRIAAELERPCTVIELDGDSAAGVLLRWLQSRPVRVLNVAGPRESQRPGIGAAARRLLLEVLPRTRSL